MLKTNSHNFVRLLIGRDELGRLPGRAERLHVCSGQAWVSVAGRDYIVGPGETLRLPASRYPALVSAMRSQGVVVEVRYPAWPAEFRLTHLRAVWLDTATEPSDPR